MRVTSMDGSIYYDTLFCKVNSELKLVVLIFLRIFSFNCS